MADLDLRPPASRRERGGAFRFALSRVRRSRVLQACAATAFLEYGALAILVVFGERLRPHVFQGGTNFSLAAWLALCSLGSWFFLFAWYPFLETLFGRETGDGSASTIGRVLETFAIGCVAVVHGGVALFLGVALQRG